MVFVRRGLIEDKHDLKWLEQCLQLEQLSEATLPAWCEILKDMFPDVVQVIYGNRQAKLATPSIGLANLSPRSGAFF